MLLVSCTWILILSPSPNAYFIVSLPTQLAKALFGWQQCFSLTPVQYQPPATSQSAVFFSHNKSVSATSHQPAERNLQHY
jgi:hypothetical protein